eukprot:Hpha_TRINITY_DN12081_c0_g1::TRINITY_DN12081_c0_g1_i1::g.141138::m.141138
MSYDHAPHVVLQHQRGVVTPRCHPITPCMSSTCRWKNMLLDLGMADEEMNLVLTNPLLLHSDLGDRTLIHFLVTGVIRVSSNPQYEYGMKLLKRCLPFLLPRGSDVVVHRLLSAPLIEAVDLGAVNVVRLLINAGATVTQYHGHTPLHTAVQQGHPAIVDLLVEKGAHVNAQDEDGNTPSHFAAEWAVENNDTRLFRKLKDAGADMTVKNEKRLTPAGYAMKVAGCSGRHSNYRTVYEDIAAISRAP